MVVLYLGWLIEVVSIWRGSMLILWLQAHVGLVTMADTPHLQWHLGTYSTTRENLDAVAELCYTDGALNITAAIE